MSFIFPLQPFRLLAADLSLRRPAFAILLVDPIRQLLQIETLVDIDNRIYAKPHGFLLKRIHDMTASLASEADVFVREGGYINPNTENTCLFEVAGVTDMALWTTREARFADVPATQIKKMIGGRGTATKEAVAYGLERFVGYRAYDCLDQSDAVAAGVSWLILTGILQVTPDCHYISRVLNCNSANYRESITQLRYNMRKEKTTWAM